jgi:uncharacterized protein (TIGR02099 family)
MIKKTSRWITIALFTVLVLIASLILITRVALPQISSYEQDISSYLSKKLDAQISIGAISATWQDAKPQFYLHNIQLIDSKVASRAISITNIQAQLDVIESIRNFAPIFKNLTVDGLSIEAEQVNKRWLTVFSPEKLPNKPNIGSAEKKSVDDSSLAVNRFLEILSNQSQIVFNDAQLILKPDNKPLRTVGPIQFLMQNTNEMHQLSGRADLKNYGESSSVAFAVQAEQLSELIVETPYKVYAQFNNISQQLFAYNLINVGESVKELSLDTKIWATFQNGIVSDVTGSIDLNSLVFNNENSPKLVNSALEFSLDRKADKQYLSLFNIDLYNGVSHLKLPLVKAIFNTRNKGFIEQLSVSNLDLTAIGKELPRLSFVDPKLKAFLATLNAQGKLENIVVDWDDGDLLGFELKADLHKLSANSYIGAPALSGVSGLLQMTALTGSIDLQAEQFGMYFPNLYADKWHLSKATGRVNWQVEKNLGQLDQVHVKSQLLSLQEGKMWANGRFSLQIPLDKTQQTELILMIGLQAANVKKALTLVPPQIVGQSLTDWLKKAALEGSVDKAAVVVRTGFRKEVEQKPNPSVQVAIKVGKSKINFDNSWPNYLADSLLVNVEDERIVVQSEGGQIASNLVSELVVSKDPLKPMLYVSAKISGDVKKLYTSLQSKPAIKLLPKDIRDWQLAGQHKSKLQLVLPLQSNNEGTVKGLPTTPHINLVSQFKNSELIDKKYDLAFKDINGSFSFDTDKGINSKQLKLSAFGLPAKVVIKTEKIKNVDKSSISLDGAIDAKHLKRWLDVDKWMKVAGKTKYNLRLDLCPQLPSCNQLVINSNLVGVTLDLPKPWGKSAKQSRKLQLINNTKSESQQWRYNYADIVRGITVIENKEKPTDQQISYTNIVLGGQRPSEPKSKGIYIGGTLNSVNLDELSRFYSQSVAATTESSKKDINKKLPLNQSNSLQRLDLRLSNATLLGDSIASAWFDFSRNAKSWVGQFNTSIASGKVNIPHHFAEPVTLRLNKLIFESKDNPVGKSSKKGSQDSSLSSIDATSWPKIILSIDQLILNKLNIGRWSAFLAPTKQGYKASNISGAIVNTKVSGEVAFANSGKAVNSFLDLKAAGGDFGAVLKRFGQAKVLESKSTQVNAALSWPGYPWSFDQARLTGRVDFKLTKGRVIEAGTSANFLRIFGILNLNSVIKRLKLDFSDLLKSGVAFDQVTAKYYLQKGIATSEEPLKLLGDSTSIEMKGSINFIDKTLDQTMEVALPLTSNAPLAALLLATPQVAGIAFVVDKILGKQLAKLTAFRYAISGSWTEPEIKPVRAKAAKKPPRQNEK